MNERKATHTISLSRNWGGDHYVMSVRPPLSPEGRRFVIDHIDEYAKLANLGMVAHNDHTRISYHNYPIGEEGLRNAGARLAICLAEFGIVAELADQPEIPQSQNG